MKIDWFDRDMLLTTQLYVFIKKSLKDLWDYGIGFNAYLFKYKSLDILKESFL